MHSQRRGESRQDAQRRLQVTRKRLDAVLSKLEALESQDTLPPVLGSTPRLGPLDVRVAPRSIVPIRQAVFVPSAPHSARAAFAGGRGEVPAPPMSSPRGSTPFRRVARVQVRAEQRFRETQRQTLFGDSQPIEPVPGPLAIPPASAPLGTHKAGPRAVSAADSNTLLREFEQAWMEAGRAPSPTRRTLAGTPPKTWRWRTGSSASGVRTPRSSSARLAPARVVQTARVSAHAAPPADMDDGAVDWDRALAELRHEEQLDLESHFRATQPMNSVMGRGWADAPWQYRTTPGWILDNLDEPELYTYTLRKRRVRVKTDATPEPTPEPPRTPTPEPEPEPAPPPPPESADDKMQRVAAETSGFDLPVKTLKQLATRCWALLHKARIMLVAESCERDGTGKYRVVFPTNNGSNAVDSTMPRAIMHAGEEHLASCSFPAASLCQLADSQPTPCYALQVCTSATLLATSHGSYTQPV